MDDACGKMYRPRRKVGLQHTEILHICDFSAAQLFPCSRINQKITNMIWWIQIAHIIQTVTDSLTVACGGHKSWTWEFCVEIGLRVQKRENRRTKKKNVKHFNAIDYHQHPPFNTPQNWHTWHRSRGNSHFRRLIFGVPCIIFFSKCSKNVRSFTHIQSLLYPGQVDPQPVTGTLGGMWENSSLVGIPVCCRAPCTHSHIKGRFKFASTPTGRWEETVEPRERLQGEHAQRVTRTQDRTRDPVACDTAIQT